MADRAIARWLLSLAMALPLLGCPHDQPEGGESAEPGRRQTPPQPSNQHPAARKPSKQRARGATSTAPNDALSRRSPSATQDPLVLIAGGDVSYGRLRGQRLLREKHRNDLAPLKHLLDQADVRFVNLECTISERQGETQSPRNQLIFTAPPSAAASLARAQVDIVSLANNHSWDYGRAALFETFEHLSSHGIEYVGAGRHEEETFGPKIVERRGFKLAFVAATALYNQDFSPASHPASALVAKVSRKRLLAGIAKAKMLGAHKIVVSFHGGDEYLDKPHTEVRKLLDALIDAGADAIIGHHPHVIQPIALRAGKPIFYSLGNLLMRMVNDQPWTQFGMLARLRFYRDRATESAICPFRIHGLDPIPLAGDPHRKALQERFRYKLGQLQRWQAAVDPASAVTIGPFDDDGCAPLKPAAPN